MGGASEKRIQALIRPVVIDLLNDKEILKAVREKLGSRVSTLHIASV